MTDPYIANPRIEGEATKFTGQAQDRFGRLLGDDKLRLEGAYNQAKGKAGEYYGRAMDELDRLVERAPVGLQDRARSTIEVARRKPLLTTAIVAGLGILLARSSARR